MMQTVNGLLRRVPAGTIYLAGAGWALWVFWLGLNNQLGPEPINALEREYGSVALKLLVAGLAVSPLRKLSGLNLMKFRRAIGVTCFFFVLAHFTVWAVLDVQSLSRVWADIVKRPYITLGMAGLALLLPLAATSNNLSVRRLGALAWRKLHKLTYAAAVLGAAHYVLLAKGFQLQPLVYLLIIVALLAFRLELPGMGQRRRVPGAANRK